MKSNDELRGTAIESANLIKRELEDGGGKTINSLARLLTHAQICSAALNQLKERANSTAREDGQ